jgi:hypothetical protein
MKTTRFKLLIACPLLLLSTVAAKANPTLTLLWHVDNNAEFVLFNGTFDSITEVSAYVGGYVPGSFFMDGWSVAETPRDLDGDAIFDGSDLHFNAGNPLGYITAGDTKMFVLGTIAQEFQVTTVSYGTVGGFGYTSESLLPHYLSTQTQVPDNGLTALMLGVTLLGAIAAYRRADHCKRPASDYT